MSAAGDMSREFAQRHAGTLYDQLARDTEKILEEARTDFGRRDYPWPPETPQRPVCQAVRVKLGGPAARCGCGLVQLCLLSCEHEHMTTEWLCSCCSRAENKTCHACSEGGEPGVPLKVEPVPEQSAAPPAGRTDVPPSVQRTRQRGAGEGDSWFRGPGE